MTGDNFKSIDVDVTDTQIWGSKAVEPNDGFVKGPEVPDQTDPGFTPELSDKQIEKQLEDQRVLDNGMVLMGAAPPQVEWEMTEKWPEADCRQVISPHFNGICKYDPALDKSNWKNPDLAAEAEPAPSGSNWVNPDTKGPGVFGVGGGA